MPDNKFLRQTFPCHEAPLTSLEEANSLDRCWRHRYTEGSCCFPTWGVPVSRAIHPLTFMSSNIYYSYYPEMC